MSGAGGHINALFRCQRLLWSSCGRPTSALSRAAPIRPSAGVLPSSGACPCQASAMQRQQTFSCRFSCNPAVQHMGWNALRAPITSVQI